jgi:branched-chain amino acid transport system permease protein
MDYFLHILTLAAIYSTLAVSLDLLAGRGGMLSIAQAAFYGIGAYTTAILTVRCGIGFPLGLLGGMLVAVLISFIVSLSSLRLHDDYFVIATFGFQMILLSAFNNWMQLTRGPLGIPGIPRPTILGWHINSHLEFFGLAALLAAFACLVVSRIATSPFGRVLHAIREDELLPQAFGKNTLYFKVTVFAVSAALAAMAGGLYAHFTTYVDPSSFTVMESILIISMVIIGGPGTLWGPILGATVLVTLPEALRFIGLPAAVAANLRQIIYGAVLVTMLVFRPRGLLGRNGLTK